MTGRSRPTRLLAGLAVAAAAGAAVWAVASGGGADGGGAAAGPAPDGTASARSPGAEETAEAPGVTWTWSVVVDSGPGRVGPWRMNESDWRYVDDPTVALDGEGRASVAWVDQARKAVLFQRYAVDGEPVLDEPVDVSRSPETFSWLPRIVVAPGDPDRVHLLWQEIVFSGGTHGGEAFFARSTDGGRTFGEPVNLSRTRAGAGKGRLSPRRWDNGSLDLALGPEGDVLAAWTVYEGGLRVARSGDGGVSFSEPLRVTVGGEGEPARGPSLAAGPGDRVHLVWSVGEDPAADLRRAVSEDGGRSFGPVRVLFEGDGHADGPKVAVDGEGAVHLAWTEAPPGRVDGHRILHARAPAPGDSFGEPRVVARPEGRVRSVRFPSVALDGGGNSHLVWDLYPGRQRHPRGLGFARSRDGGASFAEPSVVPGTDDPAFRVNGSLQGDLMERLAVGPGGELAVVNSAFEPGVGSRVRLIRGRTRD